MIERKPQPKAKLRIKGYLEQGKVAQVYIFANIAINAQAAKQQRAARPTNARLKWPSLFRR